MSEVRAYAPGRVNLIGDHTDYAGGLVLPFAIDLGTTVVYRPDPAATTVTLTSASESEPAVVPLDDPIGAASGGAWTRYIAGVVSEVTPPHGGTGEVTTTLPIGAGLSSSAAIEVATALALGFDGEPLELARACQRAEQRAAGVPSGLMDQLASAAGVDGHALLIDFSAVTVTPMPVPGDVQVVVIHSGQERTLAGSGYATRRAELEAGDPRRVRHVDSENQRVRDAAEALAAGDVETVGRLMVESHVSLRDDYEVSTPVLDALVERLLAVDGVLGARLTGAGFGGCVVALTRPDVLDEGWVVRPSAGARLLGS